MEVWNAFLSCWLGASQRTPPQTQATAMVLGCPTSFDGVTQLLKVLPTLIVGIKLMQARMLPSCCLDSTVLGGAKHTMQTSGGMKVINSLT